MNATTRMNATTMSASVTRSSRHISYDPFAASALAFVNSIRNIPVPYLPIVPVTHQLALRII